MDSSPNQLERLRLIRSPNIGPVSYRQMIARADKSALEALPDLATRGDRNNAILTDPRIIERKIAALAAAGGRYLFLDNVEYPKVLTHSDVAAIVDDSGGGADRIASIDLMFRSMKWCANRSAASPSSRYFCSKLNPPESLSAGQVEMCI